MEITYISLRAWLSIQIKADGLIYFHGARNYVVEFLFIYLFFFSIYCWRVSNMLFYCSLVWDFYDATETAERTLSS